jgi:hypothetical protein
VDAVSSPSASLLSLVLISASDADANEFKRLHEARLSLQEVEDFSHCHDPLLI